MINTSQLVISVILNIFFFLVGYNWKNKEIDKLKSQKQEKTHR